LKTGDIGAWNSDGTLRIIDRKKNFFKLSQGDYVSPERIEFIYAACPLIAQIFVDGRETEPRLIAIIVPNGETVKEIIGENEQVILNFR
jgi:long-chain acyl-CoA synthetase